MLVFVLKPVKIKNLKKYNKKLERRKRGELRPTVLEIPSINPILFFYNGTNKLRKKKRIPKMTSHSFFKFIF